MQTYVNDVILNNFPKEHEKTAIVDDSLTEGRHAYNLLKKSGFMSDSDVIFATRKKVMVLCGEKNHGVIPSMFKSYFDYPSPVERAIYNLTLCQYAKGQFASLKDMGRTHETGVSKSVKKGAYSDVGEMQAKIDELSERFSKEFVNYLASKDGFTTHKKVGANWWTITYEALLTLGRVFFNVGTFGLSENAAKVAVKIADKLPDANLSTYEEFTGFVDVAKVLKEIESISVEARKLYRDINKTVNATNPASEVPLSKEEVAVFAEKVSKIATPLADYIKDDNQRKLFDKSVRYAFSLKGSWANEETILALSKLCPKSKNISKNSSQPVF